MLKAVNIHKSYRSAHNELSVLKGIDFDVAKQEIVSIVGPSGAGKSTLLHILGGLDKPNQGTVDFDGEDIYGLNNIKRANLRNTKIGFVFQFYHLLPEFNALENVALPAMIRANTSHVDSFTDRAERLLEQVGLAGRLNHRPSQLSGGEQQRVAIARALMNEPAVILCDEPTGNLDSQTGGEIIELLLSLNKNNGQTLVLVTHDEKMAKRSHRTFHMKDGLLMS